MSLYKQLTVWKKSMDLVSNIYKLNLPNHEQYGLISQLRRCAVSIPSNIAEGNGRNSSKDFIRFLNMSRGSLFELQTQIEITIRLRYITQKEYDEIINLTNEINAMINGLIDKLHLSNS